VQSLITSTVRLMPLPFHRIAVINGTYRRTLHLLRAAETWDAEQVRAWQLDRVRRTLIHAASQVPYYRTAWRHHNFDPTQLRRLDELRHLPTVDKATIKRQPVLFEASGTRAWYSVPGHTGGSTSEPMRFLLSRWQRYAEKAFFSYIWGRYGYRLGDRCVLLKGDKVAQPQRGIYWRFDPVYNYLRCDSDYASDPSVLPAYDRAMREFDAAALFGYPSSLYQLALNYRRCGLEAPRFPLLLLASENTYPEQIEVLREVFRCDQVFYHYGHSEYAGLAWKHRDRDSLGFVPFYGYAELLDEDGTPVTRPGDRGEIVVTGYGDSMPFIRYRTSDYATLSDYRPDDFMRSYLSVERIEGRLQEFIVTRDHRLVSICTMGAAHFDEFHYFLETQYRQRQPGRLTLNVRTEGQLDPAVAERVRHTVERKLEHSVDVEVRQVDQIHRPASGKKLMIRQELDVERFLHSP